MRSNLELGQRVSKQGIEALLAQIAGRATDARAGIFGPGSASWKINRESALFLGAGRAALLQLAHPWVARALVEHSNVMSQPIVRFHHTFRIVFTMIFGSVEQSLSAARYLYQLHTTIRGEMPEDVARYRRGSHYEANEVGALRWVFATLIESAAIAYGCVMPTVSATEFAAFYADSKTLAALFGLGEDVLPADWAAFLAYCREMEESDALGVSEAARSMGHDLLAGAGSWIHPPRWYRALTAEWLPERFRVEFGLEVNEAERSRAERARRRLPAYYGRLPAAVRFVGPWHEAMARIEGREAGFVTRASNRFWIGVPRLPFSEGRNDLKRD